MKRNSSKIMLAINIFAITLLLTLNYFYQIKDFDYTLKCICSSIFAVLGLINFVYALATKRSNKRFFIGMTIAIIFSMLGDVILHFSFVAGVGAFAISHIFFIITYCFIQKFQRPDLLIACLTFVPIAIFLIFCPVLHFEEPIFKPVCVIYASIISTMFGKATGNFIREKNLLNGILAGASLLFLFSDFILVFSLFSDVLPWANNACMATYYPSLCIFAFSIFLRASIPERNKAIY